MTTVRLAILALLLAPALAFAEDEAPVSRILFLNRCRGGCTVRGGVDDARAMTTSLSCANNGANCGGGGCVCTDATGWR